jgi:6,7-dimethyl-8-ribityllumazine synthase
MRRAAIDTKGHSMQDADKGTGAQLDGEELRIGIVQSRFNAEITEALAQACRAELLTLGVAEKYIRHVTVPGALEVPMALGLMADSNDYDALIALGCVIRGETYHFELVANESGTSISRITLAQGVPIANAILTVESLEQAAARAEDKGRDAARVAVEMANLLEDLG